MTSQQTPLSVLAESDGITISPLGSGQFPAGHQPANVPASPGARCDSDGECECDDAGASPDHNLPDNPHRLDNPPTDVNRYDRQLRLWGNVGQIALHTSHVLLLNFAAVSGSQQCREPVFQPSSLSPPSRRCLRRRWLPRSCCAVGSEALKNLVLAGLSRFTIVDPDTVQSQDIAVNFFLTPESEGRSRAQETCRYLLELNPATKGHAIVKNAEAYVHNIPSDVSLVIAVGPAQMHDLDMLQRTADESRVPLLILSSVGFYGQISTQLPRQFHTIQSHMKISPLNQLRLLHPWDELSRLAESVTGSPQDGGNRLEGLQDNEHSRIPASLVVLYYIQKWKYTHEGFPPDSPTSWTALADEIAADERTDNPDGGEDNFQEAAKLARSLRFSSVSYEVPENLSELFEQCPSVDELAGMLPTTESAQFMREIKQIWFWIVIRAIMQFYATHGVIPLPGSVPDMIASTAVFLQLQKTYRDKAIADQGEIEMIARGLEGWLHSLHPVLSTCPDSRYNIPTSMIEECCRNGAEIRFCKGTPHYLACPDFPPPTTSQLDRLAESFEYDDPESPLAIRIAFFVLDRILAEKFNPDISIRSRIPISSHIHSITLQLSRHKPVDPTVSSRVQQTVTELLRPIVRFSQLPKSIESDSSDYEIVEIPELHATSAIVGGIASQEALKILTGQYVTENGVIVWDGVRCRTMVDRIL